MYTCVVMYPIYTHISHYGVCNVPYGATWGHMELYWAIWAIWGHMGPCVAIRCIIVQYGPHGATWGHMSYVAIWGQMGCRCSGCNVNAGYCCEGGPLSPMLSTPFGVSGNAHGSTTSPQLYALPHIYIHSNI